MNNLEIAYDHYKESFMLIKNAEKDRNKLFILLAILISVLYIFAINPNSLYQVLNEVLMSKWGISIEVGITTIQSFLWIILLFYTIRYFQINTYVERQYKYLHNLENEIARSVEFTFEREGKGYLDKYPLLLDLIYYIYTWVFPIIYIVVVAYKIILEWSNKSNWGTLGFNTIIAGIIIMATILYLTMLHPRSSKKKLKDNKNN